MESYANQDLALLSQGARPGQDRLLELLRIAEAFPESRFARGCKAYGKIRGRSYFSPSTKVRPYSHRPAEQEAAWRAWIQEFPDHPGVDDAQYGIIRTLEWQGKRVEALRLAWSAWHNPAGDGDMVGLLSQRCLFLLDAGTTLAELQTFEKETHDPAVTYALAVRLARYHRYYEALELTRGIELTSPPHPFPDHLLPAFVTAQRASWQKLASMNVEQRAHRWAREDGWQIGYLLLWGGSRAVLESKSLPELAQRPDGPPLREEVRRANHHAVAIALFDRCNGAEALYSPIMLLEYQFHSYSAAETNLIWGDQRAVAREAERRTRELLRRYPSSSLCDDALMLVYSINGDKRLLEEVVRRYPKGDQAVNARRLLRPDNPEWLPGLKLVPRGS